MEISIKIEQIDNGFIVKLFDALGPSENDQKLFYETLPEVLEKIKEWAKEELKDTAK